MLVFKLKHLYSKFHTCMNKILSLSLSYNHNVSSYDPMEASSV